METKTNTMTDILPFLKTMLAAPGLSAYESPIMLLIREKWTPLVDQVSLSRLGSLHALKNGVGKTPRPSIMITTHMDAIGMMVTSIKDGFLHLTNIGGVDARVLPGTQVTVHATGSSRSKDLPGVVVQPPVKMLPPSVGEGPVPLDQLLVDVGLLPGQVAQRVRVGDLVSYATEPTELAGDAISGHSLDNRASVAALTIAQEELQSKTHVWDVWAVATSQEEVTLGGAYTSAFEVRPDLAVAVDVTHAKGPGATDWLTHPLGKGPCLGFGPNIHPYLYKKFNELADRLEIPHETEVMPRMSGTDAYAMQVAAEGIPTMVVSIPLRYMHTPVEVVAVKDIQRAGRLLAEFIASLEPDFMSKITWDE
jgi:putative aminopeptidase FrvX